jgi:hypothetical protein
MILAILKVHFYDTEESFWCRDSDGSPISIADYLQSLAFSSSHIACCHVTGCTITLAAMAFQDTKAMAVDVAYHGVGMSATAGRRTWCRKHWDVTNKASPVKKNSEIHTYVCTHALCAENSTNRAPFASKPLATECLSLLQRPLYRWNRRKRSRGSCVARKGAQNRPDLGPWHSRGRSFRHHASFHWYQGSNLSLSCIEEVHGYDMDWKWWMTDSIGNDSSTQKSHEKWPRAWPGHEAVSRQRQATRCRLFQSNLICYNTKGDFRVETSRFALIRGLQLANVKQNGRHLCCLKNLPYGRRCTSPH